MANVVHYLYDLGYREIGYFKFTQPVNNCDERYEGYLAELERLGLPAPEPIWLKPTVDGAFEDMKNLIKNGAYVPHGAVVADNDTVAIGAVKAIREAGYSIPEDMSIIGFDDIPFSAVTMPALTTMRISRSAMGMLAVDMIRQAHQISRLAGHAHAHRRQADRAQQHPAQKRLKEAPMLVGRVTGNVVSTNKVDTLHGAKLLIVQPVELDTLAA